MLLHRGSAASSGRRFARAIAASALPLLAAEGTSAAPVRQVRVRHVEQAASLPLDFLRPEGKTRWDLSGLPLGASSVRAIAVEGGTVTVDEGCCGPGGARLPSTVFVDPAGGDAAVRWVLPERHPADLRMGTTDRLEIEERIAGGSARLRIETAIVGIGWVHLASGPREVVVQRATIERTGDDGAPLGAATAALRWIDPRAGVVAESRRPAEATSSLDGASGAVVEEVLTGAADLKIYVHQFYFPNFHDIAYGWDRGANTPVASLVPTPGINTVGDLIGLSAWDFSGVNTGTEVAQTAVPVNSSETCLSTQCGYAVPGAQLGRQDRNFPSPSGLRKNNQVTVREDRAQDVTIWLRAGAQNEGRIGLFGAGESRYCWLTTGGTTRSEMPLWRFQHQDANGWFMQPGDSWFGGSGSACQQTFFASTILACGSLALPLYARGANPSLPSDNCANHEGRQSGVVLKTGVATVPSGHTFNVQLVKTLADYCVYSDSGCTNKQAEVRTVVYLWQAPYLGTVAFLQSVQNPPDDVSWTTVAETNMKYGLFPPLSISVVGSTTSSVSLSWDPGRDVRRISGYQIYWNTASGSSGAYAFDSTANSGQVSWGDRAATISGLLPGTTYYFTVTSKSVYTDPSSGVPTTYESLLYPTQVSGDPGFVYPVEVQATTESPTCIPTAEVTGLTVGKVSGQYRMCWNPVTDPCLQGYDVLGAVAATPVAGFATVGQVGSGEQCWTGSPSQGYFLVVARGTGGSGPTGH